MMRPATILAFTLGVAACGGGSGDDDDNVDVDAGLPNSGFVAPDAPVEAFSGDEPATLDLGCLNTPSDDAPNTVDITLTGVLNDFQYMDNEIRDANVEVFHDIDIANPIASFGPTDNTGAYSLTIPSAGATGRYGFKVSADSYMDTFLLNQRFSPDLTEQTLNISAISEGVATALPAIIGLQRTPGTGVLAGAMRDCAGNELANAVATVSATSGTPDHLEGAVTYYLDAGAGLPVRNEELIHTDANGIFAIFELPVTASAYIQVWGFVDDADLADGEMTLLAELAAPVVADTVITGSIEPLRTE